MLFLGVLPKVILSDNLKAYVSRPDRDEPSFTQLCEQLGAHYQIDLQATRVGKPKDKASVENAVTQVYRRIYAPLRNEIFHSIEALNEAIGLQLIRHNDAAYFLSQAARIGPATEWTVQQVLLSRFHEAQAYDSCRGILRPAETHGPERLEQAAKRCQDVGKGTYGMLKRILQLKLDQADEEKGQLTLGLHENIRGPEHYQ